MGDGPWLVVAQAKRLKSGHYIYRGVVIYVSYTINMKRSYYTALGVQHTSLALAKAFVDATRAPQP